ncbi:hypothetical protein [Nannocystis pusilla]
MVPTLVVGICSVVVPLVPSVAMPSVPCEVWPSSRQQVRSASSLGLHHV